MLIRIILIIFSLLMLYRVMQKYSKKSMSWLVAALWFLFWLSLGIVNIFPNLTSVVANFFGVGRGADLAVYSAIVVLFYLAFRLFVKIEKIERDMTKIVRAVAIGEPAAKNENLKTTGL